MEPKLKVEKKEMLAELEEMLSRAINEAGVGRPGDTACAAAERIGRALLHRGEIGALKARARGLEEKLAAAEEALEAPAGAEPPFVTLQNTPPRRPTLTLERPRRPTLTTRASDPLGSEPMDEEEAEPDPCDEILDDLGGREAIERYAPSSSAIFDVVDKGIGHVIVGQHPIYTALGLTTLLEHAETFKRDFDALCARVVDAIREHLGIRVEYLAVPVKSYKAALSKVSVDYKGDCARLNDAVRGTILLVDEPSEKGLQTAYDVLEFLTKTPLLSSERVSLLRFKDRYQTPLGTYRDWTLIVSVSGFTCELQINFKKAQDRKKGGQHRRYTFTRLANRKLLEGAMQGDDKMVQLILSSGGNTEAEDDQGFRPLHFGARHGNAEMIGALLENGANVLTTNASEELPLYHAVRMRHANAARVLTKAMEGVKAELPVITQGAKASIHQAHVLASDAPDDADGWPALAKRIAELASYALYRLDYAQASNLPAAVLEFVPIADEPRVRAATFPLDALERAVRNAPKSAMAVEALHSAVQMASTTVASVVDQRIAQPGFCEQVLEIKVSSDKMDAEFAKEYEEGWSSIEKEAGDDGLTATGTLCEELGQLATGNHTQRTAEVAALYADAARVCTPFREALAAIACDAGVPNALLVAPLKKCARIIEKVALIRGTRADASGVCDVVRGCFTVPSLKLLADLLRALIGAAQRGVIEVVHVKDRIRYPSKAAWRDVIINLAVTAGGVRHICEVQLRFEVMSKIGKDLSAYHLYERMRNAIEIASLGAKSPDSVARSYLRSSSLAQL